MTEIEITIVVPTFNRVDSLKDTLESLCNQTYPSSKYEIIVCDDSTSPSTNEFVLEFIRTHVNHNIRYFKANSVTKGPANARNVGIKEATAPIVGFTDDDCFVSKDWISNAKKEFETNEDICGLYGVVETAGTCKKNIFRISRRVDVWKDDGSYTTPNVFYKKDVLLRVGCFDVTQRYLEDIELGWRVEKCGQILFSPSLKVNHKILCLTVKEYLYRLRVIEYWVMMYSKHPEHLGQDKFAFWRMQTLRPLYVSFSLLTLLSLMFSSFSAYYFGAFSLIFYSLHNVFIDYDFKKYIKRFLKLPIVFVVDIIKCYYSIKGSILYNFFVLY